MTVIGRLLGAHPKRRLIAGAATVVIVSVAIATVPRGSGRAPASAPPTPPYSAATPCRQDTFAHVHHPARLRLVAPCATVTGTVASVRWQPTDGDWRVRLKLDAQYARYVRDVQAPLEVHVIPTDVPEVVLPQQGSRIAASGAWVRNRNRSGLTELHPAWNIKLLAAAPVPASQPATPEPAPAVHVDAPSQVRVGERFTISASVTRPGAQPVPVPAAHLWLEVLPERGPGVQWRAEASDTRGVARLPIVALYRPGRYEIHLYVERRGRVASTVEQLEVIR